MSSTAIDLHRAAIAARAAKEPPAPIAALTTAQRFALGCLALFGNGSEAAFLRYRCAFVAAGLNVAIADATALILLRDKLVALHGGRLKLTRHGEWYANTILNDPAECKHLKLDRVAARGN